MNRFRTKRTSPAGRDDEGRLSNEADTPAALSFRSKTFRRKKAPIQPKQEEVDISTVLPSTDDFRTSLLMPNLSARFSMLREQDDPNSKIGKANDDSVLFPKRASRLNLFNIDGLSDIAEVDSVRGSIRPPFTAERAQSYGSVEGYVTDEDSLLNGNVMSRSKPGEGNTLFGGRQKIYKIPIGDAGSWKNLSSDNDGEYNGGRGMIGKAIYEDDVASSAFQRLREKEKQQRDEEAIDRQQERSSKENDRDNSPTLTDYNWHRQTTSSTTSGPSYPRLSTAATSVASQSGTSLHNANGTQNGNQNNSPGARQGTPASFGLERSFTKSKRLYGQGLDQHMFDQQSSALNRLDTLHRQRTTGGTPFPRNLSQSRSATHLNDRYQGSGPSSPTPFRAGSPPAATLTGLAGFDLGLDELKKQPNDPWVPSPSVSRPMSPGLDAPPFAAALEPNDLGKATASGAFNKPQEQFNEYQYAQRQVKLQQGREMPSTRRPSAPTRFTDDLQAIGRVRSSSFTSSRSRSCSVNQQEYQALDQILHPVPQSNHTSRSRVNSIRDGDTHGTFLNAVSSSEASSPTDSFVQNKPIPRSTFDSEVHRLSHATAAPSKSQDPMMTHPAHRDPVGQNHFLDLPEDPSRQDVGQQTNFDGQNSDQPSIDISRTLDSESSTFDPVTIDTNNGLSVLIRAHLRNDSGGSSIYPSQSPIMPTGFPPEDRHITDTGIDRSYDSDAISKNGAYEDNLLSDGAVMPPPLSVRARAMLEQATAIRNLESSKAKQMLGDAKVQQLLGGEAPRQSKEYMASWQEHMRGHHVRDGSTETQKERQEFAMELAERRRRVQDNLKSVVSESDSRSVSPGLGTRDESPTKPDHATSMLKIKASRGSLVKKSERPSKAVKMLGISNGSNIPGISPKASHENLSRRDELTSQPHVRDPWKPTQPRVSPSRANQHLDHLTASGQRGPGMDRTYQGPPRRTSSPPGRRERSNSEMATKRSESRNGSRAESRNGRRDHDTWSKHVGIPVDIANAHHPNMPQPRRYINRPPPDNFAGYNTPTERSRSAMSGRIRYNAPSPAYFDQRGPSASQTNNPVYGSRSPPTSHSATSTPPIHEPITPGSTASTPSLLPSNLSSQHTLRFANGRKKLIQKSDISEPTFINCTSSVNTVSLPAGASLSNGIDYTHGSSPPPLPPMDPRRRRTGHSLMQALGGRTENPPPMPILEDRNTFSADEGGKPKARQKIRKISSEGGGMNARARWEAMRAERPGVPDARGGAVTPMF